MLTAEVITRSSTRATATQFHGTTDGTRSVHLEPAGVLLALRHGIALPSLGRPIGWARRVHPSDQPAAGARHSGEQIVGGFNAISTS
jgi:hypothetical protein